SRRGLVRFETRLGKPAVEQLGDRVFRRSLVDLEDVQVRRVRLRACDVRSAVGREFPLLSAPGFGVVATGSSTATAVTGVAVIAAPAVAAATVAVPTAEATGKSYRTADTDRFQEVSSAARNGRDSVIVISSLVI